MKHLSWVLAGCLAAALAAGCAYHGSPHAPMTRAARSTFQPFKTDDGEARFVISNVYFASETTEQTQPHFDAWLQEWLKEFDYCRKGYDVMWTKTEPFDANPTAGGRRVTMARCR